MEWPSPVASWIADHERLVEPITFRYYEALMALGVLGVALAALHARTNMWLWPLLSLPLLLTFFHIFFHAKDRFHMPLDGVIAIFAAFALVETVRLGVRWFANSRPASPQVDSTLPGSAARGA
jgi:hypothetical protein